MKRTELFFSRKKSNAPPVLFLVSFFFFPREKKRRRSVDKINQKPKTKKPNQKTKTKNQTPKLKKKKIKESKQQKTMKSNIFLALMLSCAATFGSTTVGQKPEKDEIKVEQPHFPTEPTEAEPEPTKKESEAHFYSNQKLLRLKSTSTNSQPDTQEDSEKDFEPTFPKEDDAKFQNLRNVKFSKFNANAVSVEKYQKPKVSLAELIKTAKPMKSTDSNPQQEGRNLQSCTGWEDKDDPKPAPPSSVTTRDGYSRPEVCKMFVSYGNENFVCSGTMVGPRTFITARHCTFDGCRGRATSVLVACGYQHESGTPNDFHAHFGSAYVGECMRHKEDYDDKTSCQNGISNGPWEYDIQACLLDRPIGRSVGWFGTTSSAQSKVNVWGYPGGTGLGSFYSNAGHTPLYRFVDSSFADRTVRINNGWIFGGESGCPYYRYDSSSGDRHVAAVHTGGPTGCWEQGRRVDSQWVDIVRNYNTNTGSDYCHLVKRLRNSFSNRPVLHGVGTGSGDPRYSSASVSAGGTFNLMIALFNSGTKATGAVTMRIYSTTSSNPGTSSRQLLATRTFNPVSSLFTTFMTARNIPANWGSGARNILVTWSAASCIGGGSHSQDDMIDRAIVGSITISQCAPGCPSNWINDDYCDAACNVAACNYDGSDCQTSPTPYPTLYPTPYPTPYPTEKPGLSCDYVRVGDGFCRTASNTQGTYNLVCKKGDNSLCSRIECYNKCNSASGCVGVEFWNNRGDRTGTCELHFEAVVKVKPTSVADCYRRVCK